MKTAQALPLGEPQLVTPGPLEVYREPPAPARSGPVTPMQLLQVAMDQGADLVKLEQLMALQERWEANEARRAYVAAMAEFKRTPLRIEKRKRVNFANKTGGQTDYMHATLAHVCDVVVPRLAAVGISHSWDPRQEGGIIYVTCKLTHNRGHSESTTLFASADQSGGKNAIQAVISTVTYLKRDTLKSICGVAEHDDESDDDGRAAGKRVETITENQALDLEALITEVGANRAGFLGWCKVDDLRNLPASKLNAAVQALEARRRA